MVVLGSMCSGGFESLSFVRCNRRSGQLADPPESVAGSGAVNGWASFIGIKLGLGSASKCIGSVVCCCYRCLTLRADSTSITIYSIGRRGGCRLREGRMATPNRMGAVLCAVPASFVVIVAAAQAQGVSFIARRDFDPATAPYSVAVGDFNGDGVSDLAVGHASSRNVSVLLGNRDGSFRPARNFEAGSDPSTVAGGDFNGCGIPHLAAANLSSANVSALLGNGDGSFQPARNFGAGGNPYSLAVGDFNGDGIQDLAVPNSSSNNVSVLLGNGDGSFQPARNFDVGNNPYSLAVGDLKGDGGPGLAVANSYSYD